MDEVEKALNIELSKLFTSPEVVRIVLEAARAELAPKPGVDADALEVELRRLRQEQANLTQAIAAGGDIPALVAALRDRQTAIRQKEAALASARRQRGTGKASEAALERFVRARLEDLAGFLACTPPERAREFYRALFPDGLWVKPVQSASLPMCCSTTPPTSSRSSPKTTSAIPSPSADTTSRSDTICASLDSGSSSVAMASYLCSPRKSR